MKKFYENLKMIRKELGLSQAEFAEQMNTTQQRVSEWECGKIEPSLTNIIKMIRVLDTSFEELMLNVDAC